MKKILLIIACLLCASITNAIDLSITAGVSQPINKDVESKGWVKIETPIYKNLSLGIGAETGSRTYILELYEYKLFSLYAKQEIQLTDRLSTFLSVGYFYPQVTDKGLTTKEAFMYYAGSELPDPMTFYDRVDVDVKGNFGGEIGLIYKVSKHFEFITAYRMLKLTENIRGYGFYDTQCVVHRNAFMDRDIDYSAFMVGIKVAF
jgi:hypothetical protein